jgi:hypothetical protein
MAREPAANRPEALEIMKFYHGVVLPRQSFPARSADPAFLCVGQNPCAIFVREIKHSTPEQKTWRPKPQVPKNLFKTKAKGVKQ